MANIVFAQAQSVTTKTQSGGTTDSNYIYPTGLGNNGQDFIKFTAREYSKGGFATALASGGLPTITAAKAGKIIRSAILPIQSSITDSNMVSWGQDELNSIDAAAAGAAFEAIQRGADEEGIAQAITAALSSVTTSARDAVGVAGKYKKEIAYYFASKAANVNNLLARAEGKVVNPNMELLFQGPALRPFTFTFRLSPRDASEAISVKNIIRFFKENMAPKRSGTGNLFLEAPNLFQIEYVNGKTNKEHLSLPFIKICALQTCSVDYTPDGQYMTYNDDGASMTSYGLTLQFTELEPVYQDEYSAYNKDGVIGI
jgi:hypothetical protein